MTNIAIRIPDRYAGETKVLSTPSVPAHETGIQQFIDAHRAAYVRERDDEIRRMLGLWVSELEPQLVRRVEDGAMVGLTVEGMVDQDGRVAIVIPARPPTPIKFVIEEESEWEDLLPSGPLYLRPYRKGKSRAVTRCSAGSSSSLPARRSRR